MAKSRKAASNTPATSIDISPYVVHEMYLADHRTDGKRSGEGSIEVLKDDSLMIVYSQFEGVNDEDKATLAKQISEDGGKTWSKPKQFIKPPADVLNLMSFSTLRLADGRVAMLYFQKQSLKDCRPRFFTSTNEGKTWSKPIEPISTKDNGYYVGNNDRLAQLACGRILMPVCEHGKDIGKKFGQGLSGCVYSDDAGATWQAGQRQGIEPKYVAKPKFALKTDLELTKFFTHKQGVVCQEPGVVELPDGRVMMWCRTDGGYMYHCFSKDGGVTFSPFKALKQFAMPCAPQSIKRIPGTGRLLMLYNDRGEVPMGDAQFHWRRTLDIAVSDDNAKTWRRLGTLEPKTVPANSYYSICFHKKNVVFTYYEATMITTPQGIYRPENLHSLKLKIVKQSYFMK